MNDLNLPIIKESLPPPILSMDAYLQFVEFYRKHLLNRKFYEDWLKKQSTVNVRFTLK